MTPEQIIKYAILAEALDDVPADLTGDQIDELYEENEDACEDVKYEIREGRYETNLPCQHSRHYESQSVAAQAPNGLWVGWTYWYGGGKHGEPEAIDWIEDAYLLDVKEEQKMVTVRTFTKAEAAQ
jgi:hypothetical protein